MVLDFVEEPSAMNIKPIKTAEDYQVALKEIERLFEAVPDTSEGDRLEVLVTLVEAYERRHYSIPLPDPIEAIEYYMESRGLSRRDLEPYIGSRARISEILNRRRPLTLRMIRNLEEGLGIPAEILVQPYDLVSTKEEKEVEEEAPAVARKASAISVPSSFSGIVLSVNTKDKTKDKVDDLWWGPTENRSFYDNSRVCTSAPAQ
jgi:HTH-type transcriptional regulator/antitoxin HigA